MDDRIKLIDEQDNLVRFEEGEVVFASKSLNQIFLHNVNFESILNAYFDDSGWLAVMPAIKDKIDRSTCQKLDCK